MGSEDTCTVSIRFSTVSVFSECSAIQYSSSPRSLGGPAGVFARPHPHQYKMVHSVR